MAFTTLDLSKQSGVVETDNLGSGTASSSTVLYGDKTYKAEPSGNHVLLGQAESSSADSIISVEDKFSTTYDFYVWHLMWLQTTDGSDTRFRWLTSGSTEVSGSHYVYTSDRHEINSTPSTYAGADHSGWAQSYALLTNNMAPASETDIHTLNMYLYNPYKGSHITRAKAFGFKSYIRTDNTYRGGTFTIDYKSGTGSDTYSGFKVWASSGYMTNYKWQLYGIKGS